ncbi:MAG: M20/M25/M40 family metallo-hydrolase [Clostridia bacterium]|nr:M20/M25/M40 family metallo-hydrolase [Clostridia bacterium]
MKCEQLFKKIDELYEKYIPIWEDVCNLESPTEYKKGVDEVGTYFIKMAEKCGWVTEVFHQPISGNVVCITMNPQSSANPVTLSGHIDTVHPIGSFGSPAVRRDEKNIYGPGVSDCKGGVVAAFLAMDALCQCGFNARPVQLLLQTDEERNSMPSNKENINYICKKAENSIAFLNCERNRAGSVVLFRKGIIRYRFTIKGKGIHSSQCVNGASAITEAAHKILQLEKLKNENGVTCNCGIINGGTTANTVPDNCVFVADIRFSSPSELDRVKKYVEEISKTAFIRGCSCRLEQIGYRPSMNMSDVNNNLLNCINRIYSENGLPVLKAGKSMGGSDAAEVTEHGIPCVDSIGVEGDYIHTINEYAVLESLRSAAKRLASVVYCI